MNIEEVNPEGRAIRRCSMCSTEFYFGQLDHVPAHCPNVGCDGKLGAELGFVGNDVVFPSSAPPPGTEFMLGRRDLFVSPPCPVCEGKGQVKTARSVCYDILREILREARQFNPKEFRIVATPAVVEMLLDEESQHLAGLSDFIGKPISLQAESSIGPDQYDIVLL